jgi:cell division protein FtsA
LGTILGIDIGTSKTVALIANTDNMSITGVGIARSRGLLKGNIKNIEQAANSIKQAVADAKRIAGTNSINSAIVSISNDYAKSTNSHGIVNVPSNEITISEINRVIQTALYNAVIPNDYVILQAIPYDFKVDNITSIEDPEGMSGSRLEVSIHITLGKKTAVENIKKMLKIAGIAVENIVLNSFASAISTLNDDEKEQGVALVDIGATTSDLIIFKENSVRWIGFSGVGSYHITNDLAIAIHTTINGAEEIKLNLHKWNDDDILEVPLIGDEENYQSVSVSSVKQVTTARRNEILLFANALIEQSGLKDKLTGVVLTGGFANIDNLREVAAPFFGNLSVRIAKPKEISGIFDNLIPEFSTAVGLILYSLGKHSSYEIDSQKKFRSKYKIAQESINEEHNNNLDDSTNIKDELVILDKPEVSLMQKLKVWLNDIF